MSGSNEAGAADMKGILPVGIRACLLSGSLAAILIGGFLCTARPQNHDSPPSTQQASPAELILEVIATKFDIGPSEKYLYLAIYSDRSVEFQAMGPAWSDKPSPTKLKKTFSKADFARLETLLNQPSVLNLKPKYPSRLDVIDAGTSWDITLQHTQSLQKVEIVAFDPEEARRSHRHYPDALVKLGCTIKLLRNDITGAQAKLQGECKKALKVD
jgi:hypothetical protein